MMTLLKKDTIVSKNVLFFIYWAFAVGYVIFLAGYLIAYFREGWTVSMILQEAWKVEKFDLFKANVFLMMHMILISAPSIVCIGVIAQLSSTALNKDSQQNCDLFYRCQPVPIWMSTLSKYLVAVFGALAVYLTVGIFNMLVTNLAIEILLGRAFWGMSLHGMLIGFMNVAMGSLIIGGLGFVASAVFKNWALVKGIGIVIIVEIFLRLTNLLFDWDLPSPSSLLFYFFENPEGHLDPENMMHLAPSEFRSEFWGTVFNAVSLRRVLFAIGAWGLATWLYARKEISSS